MQQRTLESGRLCIKYYKELLETIHIQIQKPSNESKQKLLNYSRMIAQSTQELVQCAKQLKGSNFIEKEKQFENFFVLGADFIDPDDPTYIAENELLSAAQSIELAAKKLSVLKPRRRPKVKLQPFFFDRAWYCQRPLVKICLIFGCLMHDSTEYCSYPHNLPCSFFHNIFKYFSILGTLSLSSV